MENRIRVGAVSYLNTKPLLWGLEKGAIAKKIHLSLDYPSRLARKLQSFEIDLGLVPVVILPELSQYHIVSDYCIGAVGKVGSVCIFSEVPIPEIKRLFLDYQSRTSVALTQILFKYYWHHAPEYLSSYDGYEREIKGDTAGLIIGDRAFLEKNKGFYEFDLAEVWKEMTGLPFVFAAWVANCEMPIGFIEDFNLANQRGFQHLEEIVRENPISGYDLYEYFTQRISYNLDDDKRKGLQVFLKYLDSLQQEYTTLNKSHEDPEVVV